MSKRVLGTKTVPLAGDTLIIKDSADAGSLKEISFDNLRVAAVVLTNTVGQLNTYTMYSDVGQTNVIGTFDIQNGSDGSGLSIPPYNIANTYALNDTVISGGVLCISLQAGNIGNVPTTVTDSFWLVEDTEKVLTYDQALSYVVGDQRVHNNKLYVASGTITAGTAFDEGLGVNQWHQAGANKPPKVTRFEADGTFTPDPLAISTKIEIQAAGGSGGWISDTPATDGCAAGTGANGGNFYSCMVNEPLTGSVAVVVGGVTPNSLSANTVGITGTTSSFGGYLSILGGAGGQITTGASTSLVSSSPSQPASTTDWGGIDATVLLDLTGQRGTSPWVPRSTDYGLIFGGNGGEAHWGRASRSDPAIYSGNRAGYASINRNGSGYGYGGCGIAVGNRSANRKGNVGGAGLTIITEYF